MLTPGRRSRFRPRQARPPVDDPRRRRCRTFRRRCPGDPVKGQAAGRRDIPGRDQQGRGRSRCRAAMRRLPRGRRPRRAQALGYAPVRPRPGYATIGGEGTSQPRHPDRHHLPAHQPLLSHPVDRDRDLPRPRPCPGWVLLLEGTPRGGWAFRDGPVAPDHFWLGAKLEMPVTRSRQLK